MKTGSIRRYYLGYECKWATNTVVHILENQEYIGCLVNFHTEKHSYKTKQLEQEQREPRGLAAGLQEEPDKPQATTVNAVFL